MKKGYSVVEILVVVGVFAVIAIIATQSINLSLKSSKKSDSTTLIKQELDYAADNIVRNLQMASKIYCPANVATPSVGFRDIWGFRGDYACIDVVDWLYVLNGDKQIASSSGETINYGYRLTSNQIDITDCSFTCYTQNSRNFIHFQVTARAKGIGSSEGASIETSRDFLLRASVRK
jgi:type II secretory pathway pseudopilin PulG